MSIPPAIVKRLADDLRRPRGPCARSTPAPPPGRSRRPSRSQRMPSVGWITSPEPVSSRLCRESATIRTASSRRSIRSVRQSLASSVAARGTLFGWSLSLASNRSSSAKPSAALPAKPTSTWPSSSLRILTASAFMTVVPRVTWPSPPIGHAIAAADREDRRRVPVQGEGLRGAGAGLASHLPSPSGGMPGDLAGRVTRGGGPTWISGWGRKARGRRSRPRPAGGRARRGPRPGASGRRPARRPPSGRGARRGVARSRGAGPGRRAARPWGRQDQRAGRVSGATAWARRRASISRIAGGLRRRSGPRTSGRATPGSGRRRRRGRAIARVTRNRRRGSWRCRAGGRRPGSSSAKRASSASTSRSERARSSGRVTPSGSTSTQASGGRR